MQLALDVSQPRSDARRRRKKDLPYGAILHLRRAGWRVRRSTPLLHSVSNGRTNADYLNDDELCALAHAYGWNQKMRRVILESPYKGDIALNVEYARACVRDSVLRGESPIASHLLFTQPGILNDAIPAERQLGIAAGHAWREVAEAFVVYTDLGISDGMQQGIEAAEAGLIPVEKRQIGWPK